MISSGELVFLLEEPSMRAFLEGLLPRVLPSDQNYLLVAHQGKSDLEASLPRKLRGWGTPGARFVVVRDQDASDCKVLKERLRELAEAAGRPDTVIRIACRELESWILGDLEAVAKVFGLPNLVGLERRAKYRQPDGLGNPAEELRTSVPGYQKVSGARRIGPTIAIEGNLSRSFQVFMATLKSSSAREPE
jgi:hypothetical protein